VKIQEIRDVVRLLQKYENPADGFKIDFKGKSKLSEFHKIIRNTSIQSDQEVARLIFENRNNATNYKTLKTAYISRVISNIPALDISGSNLSEHTKAIFKSQKLLFYIRTLIALSNRPAANHFAKRLLRLTKHFELYNVSVQLLEELRRSSMQLGKAKEHARWLKISVREAKLLFSESQIKALEEEILIHFSKSLFVDENLKAKVRTTLKKVQAILDVNETYFNRLSSYRLEYIFHQLEGNIKQSIAACDKAIAYMTMKSHMSPPSRFAEFALYKLENYILARDYENGKKAAQYCQEHIDDGMILWFTFKEYEFLLMMQTFRFDEAQNIFYCVISHPRFESLSKLIKEKWELFGFNIQYVIKSQTSDTTFQKSYLLRNKQFKSKIYNFPSYRKDKRGFNVAILTLNILVLLEESKFTLLFDHEDALASYRFKYLNEKHCRQSFTLFKLIRLMTKNEFDLSRIEKKSLEMEKALAGERLNHGEIFETIQILPPQWVWNRIKVILERKKSKS
jgi:hypothetical protein